MKEDYFYDLFYKNNKDVNFYVNMAKKYGTKRILEVGSGTGRILLKIAQEGLLIDGLEPNLERYEYCLKQINFLESKIKNNVNIFNVFSSAYKTKEKYSLVILPFRLLQEITTIKEQEELLRQLKDLIEDGGFLIFDVLYPSPDLLYRFENNKNIEIGKKHIKENNQDFYTSFVIEDIDTKNQIFRAKRIYECNDEKVSYNWTSRYLMRYEIEYLLKYLNFKIVDVFGDFEMTPFDDAQNPNNMIFIVKK